MNRVYFSLGSNLGDTAANIKEALRLLHENVRITKTSSFYETEPVGYKEQPWFLNIAAEGDTALPPDALLSFTQSIEHKMKRIKTIKNGPRIIDIDILLYNNEHIMRNNLTIPHPRMLERAFVMVPLLEIAPRLMISGKPLSELMPRFRAEEIRRRP